MSIPFASPRPDERLCSKEHGGCGYWKHHSRFRNWEDVRTHLTRFAVRCLDCETKERNERKNEDRPLWIVRERARRYARKYGVSFDFMWINMNWRSLVPMYRAMRTEEGLCTSCAHPFDSEPDVQFDHICPMRSDKDYARLHARNIAIRCSSCNRGKADKPYDEWLDQQEGARLSNEENPSAALMREPDPGPLFNFRHQT